ncbi:MAG: murein L,D-transpeptidase [Prosthecobacter sp.]|jgi:murein L,D-transpeptidase YafK|uniref:L,D-transpeptidase family protein n=1 Tax=Prosthecobacter sp. TaxID=1965333 RepID=UPI0019F4184D|nr:murein L,D-transpeptidase family protein [Prosthecobacter sp.]MBE2287545.1 murein L,D-transpeptidase [Prosthecobacter sp.]
MRPRALVLWVLLACAGLIAFQTGSLAHLILWISHFMQSVTREHLPMPYTEPPPPEVWRTLGPAERLASVRSRLMPKLPDELASKQLTLGQPAFIRIFKESRELELWMKAADHQWKLFRNYPIATFSGTLGPKTREGDLQAPEGFYSVTQKQLNPASSYHLSFNVGYPNAYDLHHQRTGSFIMVHGDTVSIGCFAMTDPLIEEIYLIVEAALKTNPTVPIHIFPFRMHASRMKKAEFDGDHDHLSFWREIEPAYHMFEGTRRVPPITVENGSYHIH